MGGVLAAAAAALVPASGLAQMRGGGGPTPAAISLDKVPVGTWAEYTVKRGDQPARKMRHALVGKEGAAFVLETSSEGMGGKTLIRTVVDADPTKEGAVKKVVMQMGDRDPMELPAAGGGGGGGEGGGPGRRMGGSRFVKPDPKKLVGKETVKVAAGTFQTEHYTGEGPRGGTIHFWISKDAGPLGLVKMEMERPGGPDGDGGGKFTTELAARGKGAKPELTKPAKPFDPEAMRAMYGGRGDGRRGERGRDGASGGGPPGGPKPGPAAPAAPPAQK